MRSMIYKWAGCMAMAAWVLGGISCTNEDITTGVAESKGEPWTITATQGGGVTTRLGYDDVSGGSVAVTWAAGDAFTVFGATGSGEDFTLNVGDAGNKSGNFTGTKPAGDSPYRAFFPKTTAASYNDCVMDLTGQTQTANESMDHLSKYDYMTGEVALDESSNPTVSFEHQMLMMKFVLTLPNALADDETLGVLSVSAVKAGDTSPLHLMKGVSGIDKDYKSNTQELILKNVVLAEGNTLTAYMMMYPFELAQGDQLIFKVLGNQQVYSATATIGDGGKKYTNGYRYTATTTLAASPIPTANALLPATPIGTALIPSGTFSMGQASVATPVHAVTLTKSFYMSTYQITNAQYAAFLNEKSIGSAGSGSVTYYKDNFVTPVTETKTFITSNAWGVTYAGGAWKAQTGYDNYPVINVTWFGAKAFADWSGGSLPTEAQWEYACRAGSTADYGMGYNNVPITSSNLGDYAWYSGNSSDQTHPVGEKLSNLWGLYDMHGNVYEWCSDWYGTYSSGSVSDPVGPATSPYGVRVLRGGGWLYDAEFCRSAFRNYINPVIASSNYGFRVLFFP